MAQSDEFIREVDEEVQRERMAVLWRRYGTVIVAVALVIVVGTASLVGWRAWQERLLERQGEAFAAAEGALSSGNTDDAIEQYRDIAENFGSDIAALARLHAADLLERDDAVITSLEAVAGMGDADPLLESYAGIVKLQRQIDEGDAEALRAALVPMADAGEPWRHSARELLALVALRENDFERARVRLAELADDATTPAGIRQRSQALLGQLGGPPEDDGDEPSS